VEADSIAIFYGFVVVSVLAVRFFRVGTADRLLGVVEILVCENCCWWEGSNPECRIELRADRWFDCGFWLNIYPVDLLLLFTYMLCFCMTAL
jgi:hypothetical protein